MNMNFIKEYMNVYIPILFSLLVIFVYQLTDSFFVASLGEEELAGFGIASTLVLLVSSVIGSVSQAISIFVSKAYGSDNTERKLNKIYIGIVITLVLSISMLLLFAVFINNIYGFYDATATVMKYAGEYYNIWYMALPIIALNLYFQAIFNVIGKQKITAYVLVFSMVINVILDYILIYGIDGILEPMYIAGSAAATVISFLISLIIYIYILVKENYIKIYSLKTKSSKIILAKTLNLSFHYLVPGLTYPVSMIILSIILTGYDTGNIAAYTLIDSFKYLLLSITTATAVTIAILVSNLSGKKQYQKIKQVYYLSLMIIASWGSLVLIIVSIYSKDIGLIYLEKESTIEIFQHIWVVTMIGSIAWAYVANTGRLMLSFGKGKYASIMIMIGNVATMVIPYFVSKYTDNFDYFIWSITLIGVVTSLIAVYFYVFKLRGDIDEKIKKKLHT